MPFSSTRSRLLTPALAAAAALAAGAAPASAATPDQLLGAVAPAYSSGCGACTILQQESAPGSPSYVVASAGVLTSWSFRSSSAGPSSARLRLFHAGATAGTWVETTQSEFHTSPAGKAETIPARIPVTAGDHLGLRTGTDGAAGSSLTGLGNKTAGAAGLDPQPGDSFPGSSTDGHRANVAAVVEPDADGDGYGDTSQDQCASDASTQGPCPVAAAATEPTVPASDPPVVPVTAPPADGPPPQQSPVAPFRGATLGLGALPVHRHRVALTLACPVTAQGPCVGRATLGVRVAKRTVRLGSVAFTVAAGAGRRVQVKVSPKLERLLTRRGARIRVALVAHDSRGITVTTTAVRPVKA